jgi:hypothetical protein
MVNTLPVDPNLSKPWPVAEENTVIMVNEAVAIAAAQRFAEAMMVADAAFRALDDCAEYLPSFVRADLPRFRGTLPQLRLFALRVADETTKAGY